MCRSNVVASQNPVGSMNGPVIHVMKIYLMQHGEALPKEVKPKEPLSPVGTAAVEATARAARRIGIRVDRLITSDKRRALETANLMADAVGVSKATIEVSTLVKAMTPAGDTITYLETFSSLEAILVVGHLPSLAGIAGSLLSEGSPAVIQFERSGICRIDVYRLPTHSGQLRGI
jgi:phosphohistidine phosphatase